MPMNKSVGRRGVLLSGMVFGCGLLATGCAATNSARSTMNASVAVESQPGGQDMGEMLITGLKATEGCLGAVGAQVEGGRLSIISWFEDKAAAMRWYNSPVHQRFQTILGADEPTGKPMAHVDDDTPIMVIATITPAIDGKDYGLGMGLKQISIEMFTPLPGGAAANGRLSPDAFPVEHMKRFGSVAEAVGDTDE